MYYTSRSDYESNDKPTYSVVVNDGRPKGCCGKGCCWWGRKKLGLE